MLCAVACLTVREQMVNINKNTNGFKCFIPDDYHGKRLSIFPLQFIDRLRSNIKTNFYKTIQAFCNPEYFQAIKISINKLLLHLEKQKITCTASKILYLIMAM